MSWSNAYLGIPYADMGRDRSGCDCWGLARLVYAEELAIHLPAYTEGYVSAEEQAEVASLIGSETRGAVWPGRARRSPMICFSSGTAVMRAMSHFRVTRRDAAHVDGRPIEARAVRPRPLGQSVCRGIRS